MRHAFTGLCLGLALSLLCLSTLTLKPSYAQDPIQVVVDGKAVAFEQPPAMRGGTVVVQLRAICEAFAATVKFDMAAGQVHIVRGSRRIEIQLGAPVASVNGQLVKMQVPAAQADGQVTVPLRFMVEAMGAEMKYAADTRTFTITSAPEAAAPKGPRIDQVVHNAQEALAVGQDLHVVLTGEAGGQASFDVVGVVKGVPLKEDAPGHYTGDLPVTAGLKVARGQLVGRIVKDGQEATRTADQTVSLAQPSLIDLVPAVGSTTPADRLVVGAQFHAGIRPDTVRLLLDGSDVTRGAQSTAGGVKYQPAAGLTAGPHEARLEAIGQDGTFVRQTWQFTVVAAQAPVAPPAPPTPTPAPTTRVSWVMPADGSTVQTARPAIQVQFTQPLQPASVLVTVDGQRVDNAVTNNGTTVSGTLTADIAPGARQATVAATDATGQPINKSWTFTVAAPPPTGPPTVSVTTPAPGSIVTGSFHIQGTSRAGAKVRLNMDLLSSFLRVKTLGKTIKREVTADNTGQFDILIEARELENYKILKLQLVGVDGEGRTSATVSMDLRRP